MTSRRVFLKQASLLGVGLTASPFIIKAGGSIAPSDKIRVGLIGCNGMGFENLKAFLRNPEVECVALADIDQNVLQNRAAETEKISGKRVKNLYKDGITVIMVSHDITAAVNNATKILHLTKDNYFFGSTHQYLHSDVGKKFLITDCPCDDCRHHHIHNLA